MRTLTKLLTIIALLGLAVPAVAVDSGAQPATKVTEPAGPPAPTTAPVVSAGEVTVEPSSDGAEVKKEAAPAELSWWKLALKHLMELVFLVLGLMAMALVRVMMKKYGFEEQSGKVNDVLMKAIGFAEQWSINKAKLEGEAAPGSAQKMEMAVDFAKKLADEYKLPKKGSDWWEHKLEGWLGIDKAKANAVTAPK